VRGLGNNQSNNHIFLGKGRAQTRGGHTQEINRVQREEVRMRRYDKQHFTNTGEYKLSFYKSTMRERLGKAAKVIKLLCKTDNEGGKREVGEFQRTNARQCPVHCTGVIFILIPPIIRSFNYFYL
jgi:hypothetical protein